MESNFELELRRCPTRTLVALQCVELCLHMGAEQPGFDKALGHALKNAIVSIRQNLETTNWADAPLERLAAIGNALADLVCLLETLGMEVKTKQLPRDHGWKRYYPSGANCDEHRPNM